MDKEKAGEKTTKERIRRLKTILEGDPASVAFFPLSKVLYAAGYVDDSISVLEKGLGYHPEFVTARMDLAKIYHEVGHDDNAIDQLEKIISLDYYNADALLALASILLEQGFNKEALRHLKRLQELDPENDKVLEMLERASQAISETKPTEISEPPKPPTTTSEFNTLTMVDIYMKQGLWKKAAEVCQIIVSKNPNNQEAIEKLSQITEELEKLKKDEVTETKETILPKSSWQAAETFPLAPAGPKDKDTADLILDKWEEFQDLIATSGLTTEKEEKETTPAKPLITDEDLEQFAASIANLSQDSQPQPKVKEEKISWEIVTAEEMPSEPTETFEPLITEEPITHAEPAVEEKGQALGEIPSPESFANLELMEIAEIEVAPAIENKHPQLEEITLPEFLTTPELEEMERNEIMPAIEVEQPRLVELTAPELILAPVLEDIEEVPTTTVAEEKPKPGAFESEESYELTDSQTIPKPTFEKAESSTSIIEEPQLEYITSAEFMVTPTLEYIEELTPATVVEVEPKFEEITTPESMEMPHLEEIVESSVAPPKPLEDIIPPDEALTLEELPTLDEIIKPPEPPKTDRLESIDDLLSEIPPQPSPPIKEQHLPPGSPPDFQIP